MVMVAWLQGLDAVVMVVVTVIIKWNVLKVDLKDWNQDSLGKVVRGAALLCCCCFALFLVREGLELWRCICTFFRTWTGSENISGLNPRWKITSGLTKN